LIWVGGEGKYFLKWGWTARSTNRPTGKSVGLRRGAQGGLREFAPRASRPAIDPAGWARQVLAMRFEILGELSGIETFATGSGIREIARLRRIYGRGRWRKRKGIARVRLSDGSIHVAELHWYEAAGIGRKEFKIKHLL
jgi:hypothetical protein